MIRKLSTKQSPQPILDSEHLQTLVAELTEQNEESVSGGITPIVDERLIGRMMKKVSFPCDGPGRGGTCG